MPSKVPLGVVVRATRFDTGVKSLNSTYLGFLDTHQGRVRAVFKDMSAKRLMNELLGAALARSLDLPIPNFFLAKVPTTVLTDLKHSPTLPDDARVVFASELAADRSLLRWFVADPSRIAPTLLAHIFGLLKLWPQFNRMTAFDEWVANVDRHLNNILWDGTGSFWLIDHDQAFTGPSWIESDLEPSREFMNKLIALASICGLTAKEIAEMQKSCSVFSADIVDSGVARLVQEYCSFCGNLLTTGEVFALTQFLVQRRAHICAIMASKLGRPMLPFSP